LLAELQAHEAAVIEALSAEPARAFIPRIVAVPPFGLDHVPDRFVGAWESLLAECPPGARPATWQIAMSQPIVTTGLPRMNQTNPWGCEKISPASQP
jgi:hypothetical protein